MVFQTIIRGFCLLIKVSSLLLRIFLSLRFFFFKGFFLIAPTQELEMCIYTYICFYGFFL